MSKLQVRKAQTKGKQKEKTAMCSAKTEVEKAINRRATKIMFGMLVMALLGLVSPTAVLAQLPAGLTAVITTLAPTTAFVTDPLTGLTESQTTREVVVDITQNNFLFTSPCTGESMTINGRLNVHFKTVTTSSGRMNEESHSNQNGSGIGSISGARYVYSHTNDFTASFDEVPALHEETMSENEHLIRQGETTLPDDFYLKFLLHITMVHGIPVVSNVTFNSGCQ